VYVLRIEHPVSEYTAWKRTFDSDPIGRQRSGVRRYRISRAAGDPNLVMIDLEFDSTAEAEAVHDKLLELWSRVEAEGLIRQPQARVVEVVESEEY
jgi:hypothetical protein